MPSVDAPVPRYRKLIRRRRALSRGGLRMLFISCVALTAGIGIGFTLVGAWLVLPFAGLEILIVGGALRLVSRHRADYELLVVDAERLSIVRRDGERRICVEVQRYWARVALARGDYGWYPSRLLIRSHGREVEVGAWMNEEAREALAQELAALVRR